MTEPKLKGVYYTFNQKTDYTGQIFLSVLKQVQTRLIPGVSTSNWDILKTVEHNPNYQKFLNSHIALNVLEVRLPKDYDLFFRYEVKDGVHKASIGTSDIENLVSSINKILDDLTSPDKRDIIYHRYIKGHHNMDLDEKIAYYQEIERREIEELERRGY